MPKESLGIPKESLGIPKESLGILGIPIRIPGESLRSNPWLRLGTVALLFGQL